MKGICLKQTVNVSSVLMVVVFALLPVIARSESIGLDKEQLNHIVGVFIGATHEGRRENEPALGLEYEYRINKRFGIGAVVEYTFGNADTWVVAIPFSYRVGEWKLYAGPGVEDGQYGNEKLLRMGAEYAFELSGGWEISPQINVDFVDNEDVWVFGAVFSKGF